MHLYAVIVNTIVYLYSCFVVGWALITTNTARREFLERFKGIRLKFWNFLYYWSDLTEIVTKYVKSKKKTLFVHETFFHLGLSFLYIYKYITIFIYIKE